MRLILDCDPDQVDRALACYRTLECDLRTIARGPGWGWGQSIGGVRFFGRLTKTGVSITQISARTPAADRAEHEGETHGPA